MRVVIQRVRKASVSVDGACLGKIEQGLLIFLGVGQMDTKETIRKLFEKIIKLRIFADEKEKTNLSIEQVQGELLVISQFTLYANCRKGNRPSFVEAAEPDLAKELYEYFLELAVQRLGRVQKGEFGADMQVELCNDGPFTIVLDSEQFV